MDQTRVEQVLLMLQLLGRQDLAGHLMRNEVARLQLMHGGLRPILSTKWRDENGWMGEWVGRVWMG